MLRSATRASRADPPTSFDGIFCSAFNYAALLEICQAPQDMHRVRLFGITFQPHPIVPDDMLALTNGFKIVAFAPLKTGDVPKSQAPVIENNLTL